MKKIGLISLALVLALGGLGVGYAHWSDQLFIETEVVSGSVTLAWVEELPPGIVDNETAEKNTAWGTQTFGEPVTDAKGGCIFTSAAGAVENTYKRMYLNVYEAYPCYEIRFTSIVVGNIGSIPVYLENFNIYDDTGELDFVWLDPPQLDRDGVFYRDDDASGTRAADGSEDIINVTVKNFVGTQLHSCDQTKGEIDLHLKQNADQCHTYRFVVELEGVQWNKSTYWD
jgi:hypothetical protein